MKHFFKSNKEHVLDDDKRPVKVIKDSDNSWHIEYDESPEALNGNKRILTISDIFNYNKK
ncbi:MAG: hypothetical protein ACP5MX_04155 [Candidatus Micrarchaeia archaeon]